MNCPLEARPRVQVLARDSIGPGRPASTGKRRILQRQHFPFRAVRTLKLSSVLLAHQSSLISDETIITKKAGNLKYKI